METLTLPRLLGRAWGVTAMPLGLVVAVFIGLVAVGAVQGLVTAFNSAPKPALWQTRAARPAPPARVAAAAPPQPAPAYQPQYVASSPAPVYAYQFPPPNYYFAPRAVFVRPGFWHGSRR